MNFPVQCRCDPKSKILEEVHILKRLVIDMNTWNIVNVEMI